MAQSNVCIRMDKDLKKQFVNLCNELGLTMSTAINLFAKAAIREKGLPFAISIIDYNEETQKDIKSVEKGLELSKPYTDIDKMFEDMLKDN